MKIEVNNKYRVKTYETRPSFWNYEGEMDYLMGKVVTVSDVTRDGLFKIEEDKRWVFKECDFEPVDSLHVGDIVIGNEGAKSYCITRKGVKCVVTDILDDSKIKCRLVDDVDTTSYPALAECFDLVCHHDAKNELIYKVYKRNDEIRLEDVRSGKTHCCAAYRCETDAIENLLRRAEKDRKFTGRVVCIESKECWWTVGKIYVVECGEIIADDGDNYNGFRSVDDMNATLSAKFIAIVEE